MLHKNHANGARGGGGVFREKRIYWFLCKKMRLRRGGSGEKDED